jgi:hypothetical protein
MATMVELDLAAIQEQRARRKAREDREKVALKRRAAEPQPEPLPEGLEERKLARAEREAKMPQVRDAYLEVRLTRVSRAERIRRLEAEVASLKAAASKR